jgi:hypothetical protein
VRRKCVACPTTAVSPPSELFAPNGFHVVAVRIDQESGVVAAGRLRAVLFAHTRSTVVGVTDLDASAVKNIDLVTRSGDERDVDGPSRLGIRADDEIAYWPPCSLSQSGGMPRVARTVR